MLKNKAESNRIKGKGRAQITARSTESRTKRAWHRKNSSNTPKSNRKKAKGRAPITARSTESRTKRTKHRKNSSNTRRTTASTGRSEQGRMWRENDKTKERRTTKRTKTMAG